MMLSRTMGVRSARCPAAASVGRPTPSPCRSYQSELARRPSARASGFVRPDPTTTVTGRRTSPRPEADRPPHSGAERDRPRTVLIPTPSAAWQRRQFQTSLALGYSWLAARR
jgi:hypothetical protein